jgi:hypothetical protein
MESRMSVNGIWQIEMLGAYGWENVSTAFMEDGNYKSASQDSYSVGSYQISENKIKVSTHHVSYGQARTLFGTKNNEISLNVEGVVDGDRITGQATDDEGKFFITFRATRLADLP